YTIFQLSSKNYESLSEILRGVSEMKLNNFETYKQNKWEKIQDEWLVIRMKSMKINQIQTVGYELINQVKNIIVIFFAANLVANNELTMGSLLSISFIIGQMNGPISDIVDFNRSFMEAKLSYSRLNEIQESKPEDNEDHICLPKETETFNQGITISNLTFRYEGINSPIVLDNVNFYIPNGKTTAIVGASGSGKTTLLKILLKYYSIEDNRILFNGVDFNKYSARSIRENSGTVMQDGFIFSETLYRNIVMSDEGNEDRFQQAIKIANLTEFINDLPLAQNTIIGNSGINISGGQKQRILIARAVYKNAKYFFFDEATSALDSENERIIYNNLKKHFENKTVIVVAHRLSTVKNADQIVVLNNGKVVEIGNHKELILNKCYYHNLVQNQLELGD
ncbi:MAG: ATP-binding cassette domain-containing protein, partial [Crocinitomicaceae bacterium]|nr:ATP-binding cassette domain-containing protein [Crocinitomicaceae bacterium]